MTIISLVFCLVARNTQLVHIDNNDEIAGIHMRSKDGFMLAPQTMGDFCGETPEYLVGRINHKPVVDSLHVVWLKRFSRSRPLLFQ